MTAGRRGNRPRWSPPGERGEAEIAEILAFREARARDHLDRLAREGPARHCPICGHRGRFAPVREKPGSWCPQCDSRPRHRLLKLWMEREMVLPVRAQVVHFSAEPWVGEVLAIYDADYRTADVSDAGVDLRLDIEAIDLPDGALDMVIANHVLEHVDDLAALRELFRVLRPEGLAVLTAPVVEGWDETDEDPSLGPEERALRYGDPDHRRFYGRDIRERIRAAGFALSEFPAVEPDVSRHALQRGERVFIGRKP
jgi:SAM-dependent methyltransferase